METLIKLKKRRVKLSYSHPDFSNPHRKKAHWKAEKLFSLHSAKRVYLSRTIKSAVNCPDTVSADWGAGPVDQLICPKNNTKISPEQVGDLSVLIMCDSWRAHCSFRVFFFSSHTVFYETHTTVQCTVQIKSALLEWFLGMEICRDLTSSADISLGGDRYFSPRRQISSTIAHYLSVWWISLRLPLVPHSAKKLVWSSHSLWWIAIIYRALITPVFKFWNYGLISCLYSMVLIPENLTGVECCLTIHNIKTFWKVECLKRC